MHKTLAFLLFLLCYLGSFQLNAQDLKSTIGENKEIDSLRKISESGTDSIVYTSKYIRYTTLRLTKDSIQTFPLDTSLNGLQNFSVLVRPRTPTIGIGNLGLAARPMLFEPSQTIGFNPGFHSLDYYAVNDEDLIYYEARSPFSSLYYVTAGDVEQVFKVVHSQNIKKNWNAAINYNRIGANGIYTRQRGDHLNAAIYTWYQSPDKRYNLWANGVFNTLKAAENGSVLNQDIFSPNEATIERESEAIGLTNSRQIWRKNSLMLRQTYFIGRIDSVNNGSSKKILPTNKVSYTLNYNADSYAFQKDEADVTGVLPKGIIDTVFTNDSTRVTHLQNEFIYTFFLRAKASSVIKNELKIDAGLRHDYYSYNQFSLYRDRTNYYNYSSTFQNLTLLGSAGYRFSNRIDLNVNLQQIFQGRQLGDFKYEAKSNILLSNTVGRMVLGAYIQNKSPEEIYSRYFSNHYSWRFNFDRTKTVNLSFNYLLDKLQLDAGAQYYLINDYLYFRENGINGLLPEQYSGAINLLKVTLGKRFRFGKFNLDSYLVYQKTDNENVLLTPEFYTFNTFYFNQTFFKVLKTNIGFDVRYNTEYLSYAYSPAASQFYITNDDVKLRSEPIVDVWIKAALRKANIFVKCDYVNQGLFSKGYYTVRQYPMQDRFLFKFGVQWNFYD